MNRTGAICISRADTYEIELIDVVGLHNKYDCKTIDDIPVYTSQDFDEGSKFIGKKKFDDYFKFGEYYIKMENKDWDEIHQYRSYEIYNKYTDKYLGVMSRDEYNEAYQEAYYRICL